MSCLACPDQEETLLHVFLHCRRALQFWGAFRSLVETDAELHWTKLKFLHFGDDQDAEALASLVLLGMHSLWAFRTDLVECTEKVVPPWERFKAKLEWTLSVVPDEELQSCWRTVKSKLRDGEASLIRQVYGRKAKG